MIPERFEKIKKVFGQVGILTGPMAVELLAALEEAHKEIDGLTSLGDHDTKAIVSLSKELAEAQQQLKELQEGNRSACESRDMAYRSRDEAVITSNQHYKQAFFLNEKLVEAQQTIAQLSKFPRQLDSVGGWTLDYKFLETLQKMTYETSEYDSSMEQIEVLLLAVESLAALANKEGSDKP